MVTDIIPFADQEMYPHDRLSQEKQAVSENVRAAHFELIPDKILE